MLLTLLIILFLALSRSHPEPFLFFFPEYKLPIDHKKTVSFVLNSESIPFSFKKEAEYDLGCHPIVPTDFLKVWIEKTKGGFDDLVRKWNGKIRSVVQDRKIDGKLFNAKSFLPFKEPGEAKNKYQYQFASKPYVLLDIKSISSRYKTTGKNVKVAIFDTGVSESFESRFRSRIKEIKNWTKERYFGTDFNGHGTFIASLFVNNHSECVGIAPDVDLYIFKVFTKTQESFTSWFLEAFNYAMHIGVDLINFSIGSTDFTEKPFFEKIKEVVSKKITIVSAAGNDGPYLGTINNPADMPEVLAVGGLDTDPESIASFSSRGPTTWELIAGMGRVKPEILSFSKFVIGADMDSGNCVMKSGTSLSTGIVTASLALVVSYLRNNQMERFINPGTLRQAVIETAKRIRDVGIFEQGAGVFSLPKVFEWFEKGENKLAIFPNEYNLSGGNPYHHPYSSQPIYRTAMPTIFNLTLMNGLEEEYKGFELKEFEWVESNLPKVMLDIEVETNAHKNKSLYFYHIGVFINIIHEFQVFSLKKDSMQIFGVIRFQFSSISHENNKSYSVDFRLVFDFIETPPREKRLLWDQFHNMKFPENSYIPRDSLTNYDYPYEWHGDHPFTNFLQLFNMIRKQDFYLEILRGSFNCFEASNYHAILIVDPEESFSLREIEKLEYDVIKSGLSLIIFADWFDLSMIEKNTYYNTAQLMTRKPIIGGSNIPALNELLEPFGIAMGSSVFAGDFTVLNRTVSYFSGSYIVKFPRNGMMFTFDLFNESELLLTQSRPNNQPVPILGLLRRVFSVESSGRIAIYGDSNCIDDSYLYNDCFTLFRDLLLFTSKEETELLSEFHDFQLPLDYEDLRESPMILSEWKGKSAFMNFSRHSRKSKSQNFCKRVTLFGKEIVNRMNEMEKQALNSVFYEAGSWEKINKWVSAQKKKGNFLPEFNLIMGAEYIQIGIMVVSISVVVFCVILVRRKRKKRIAKFSKLPVKDPILLV